MSLAQFKNAVASAEELTQLLGSPSESGADGRCDVSPRGDLPGVAKVLDSQALVMPEWKGNRRVDSLRNIIQTGRVGLLFVTPGLGETLRVNGRACVTRDNDLLASLSKQGKQPVVGIGIEVEECFFQCAKALIRSRLWEWSAQRSDPIRRLLTLQRS
jgi:PPOX class probable FMN-dependent enzyme